MFYIAHNELLIMGINLMIILLVYFLIYPQFAGSSLKKFNRCGLVATSISPLISGYLFYGKGVSFNALLFTTNWFWFSVLAYGVIELPFFLRYLKKYSIEIK